MKPAANDRDYLNRILKKDFPDDANAITQAGGSTLDLGRMFR